MALRTGHDIIAYKAPETAWKVVGSKAFDDFLAKYLTPDVDTVLLHTRAATLGSPQHKENNHPLLGDCAVVHNGVIHNHEKVFGDLKMKRQAEVDSDVIRAIVDKDGFDQKVAKSLNALAGSAAFAAIHPKWPQHVLFGRSGNPLVLASDPGFLMWASEKQALHAALRPWCQRHGIWFRATAVDAAFASVPPDTLWLMGPETLEWHEPFKASFSTWSSHAVATRTNSKHKKKKGLLCGFV